MQDFKCKARLPHFHRKIIAAMLLYICLTDAVRIRRSADFLNRPPLPPSPSVIEMNQQSQADINPDTICGLHPVDMLISGLLRNIGDNDPSSNVLMLSNSVTSLYRTQPRFYGFLMQCTTAWNKCQREMKQLQGPLLVNELQPWRIMCTAGLSLRQSDLSTAPTP